VGLLPLALLVYAVVKVRDVRFLALASMLFFLLCLSLSKDFARLMYHLPGFSLFRHRSLVFGLGRLLALFCAGFGLDVLLGRPRWRHLLWPGAGMVVLMGLLAGRHAPAGLVHRPVGAPAWEHGGWVWAFVIRVAVYGAVAGAILLGGRTMWRSPERKVSSGKRRNAPAGGEASGVATWLLAGLLLDLLLFQVVVAVTRPRLPEAYRSALYTVRVRTPVFPMVRTEKPAPSGTARDALRLMRWAQHWQASNEILYAFSGYDRWPFSHRVVLMPTGVGELILARRGAPYPALGLARLAPHERPPYLDPGLERVLAHERPKFRLASRAIFADSLKQAARAIQRTDALDEAAILREVPLQMRLSGPPGRGSRDLGSVQVLAATANRVEVEADVTTDDPTWLVYADAFHAGWRCTVNGKEVPIAEAYLAFKAVPVGKGKNDVIFTFSGGLAPKMADLLAVAGGVLCLYVVGEFVVGLVRPFRAWLQGAGRR